MLIEILWRGFTHWTMGLLGGLCFVLCGLVNNVFSFDMPLWQQQSICAGIITFLEFIFGCVLNLGFGLHIWDYSMIFGNILGQVCLPFMIAWFFLSLVAIVLDDWIRHKWFGEEKPHYVWR